MSRRVAVGAAAVVVVMAAGMIAFSGPEPSSTVTPSETLRLEVDLSDRQLSVIEEGRVIATHPVTVGTDRHPTPSGSYSVDWIVWNPSWNPPDSDWAEGRERMEPGPENPMGRVKMFFRRPAYYIHGTRAVSQLGDAASHGCVRLSNKDVLDVARIVMAHGGEARPPNWFKRVINRFRDTREVTLSHPVPVTIRQ